MNSTRYQNNGSMTPDSGNSTEVPGLQAEAGMQKRETVMGKLERLQRETEIVKAVAAEREEAAEKEQEYVKRIAELEAELVTARLQTSAEYAKEIADMEKREMEKRMRDQTEKAMLQKKIACLKQKLLTCRMLLAARSSGSRCTRKQMIRNFKNGHAPGKHA